MAIPTKDADVNAFSTQVSNYLNTGTNATRLGVDTNQVKGLGTDKADWDKYYPLSQDPNTRTKLITSHKDSAKKQLRKRIKQIFDDIPASKLTDDDKAVFGMVINGQSGNTSKAQPDVAPQSKLTHKNNLEHRFNFYNPATGKAGKPEGVHAVEVWRKIEGDAPTDEKELLYVGYSTRNPYIVVYTLADAGKKIHYMLRYVNSKGEPGPWSGVISSIVPWVS